MRSGIGADTGADIGAAISPDRPPPDAGLLVPVMRADHAAWRAALGADDREQVRRQRFEAAEGELVFLGGGRVGVGLGEAWGRWSLAAAAERLPGGAWVLAPDASPPPPVALHGWMMAQHDGVAWKAERKASGWRVLHLPAGPPLEPARIEARASALVRDLVDTPAEAMGPAELEGEARALAARHGARVEVVAGEALLEAGLPAVHAVGRASRRRPRMVRLGWGSAGPLVALVGKGVTFDSGGLNLKSGPGMALMKKDMGGAAHALALAAMVMEAGLSLRLLLLVPAVENMVSGNSLRPGDIIATRAGLHVEVTNTDAEGRLVLADALALAGEAGPDLLLDFATLTGAARVALGPDLPALFGRDEAAALAWAAQARALDDPLWALPLWPGYRPLLESRLADLANHAEGGMAGAIVGGLFLERFVPPGVPWFHLDLFAWNAKKRPGRPVGGHAMGLAASLQFIAALAAR